MTAGRPTAAAVATFAFILAGCGGRDAARVSPTDLGAAASATERAPGASIAVNATLAAAGSSKRIVIRLVGIHNSAQHSTHLEGTYERFPHIFLDPGGAALRLETDTIRSDAYLTSTLFYLYLPPPNNSIHLDLTRRPRNRGPDDWMLISDPTMSLRALRTARSPARRAGSEEVRGVVTTHYRTVTKLGPAEVWVDAQHLVRRLRTSMRARAAGKTVTATITTELFDFGPKVGVTPPPAGRTLDAKRVTSALFWP